MLSSESRAWRNPVPSTICNPGTRSFMPELLVVRLGFIITFEVSSAICASDRPGFKFRLCLLLAVNGDMLQNRICFMGLL